MKKAILLLLLLILFISCKSNQNPSQHFITSIKIDTILKDKISIRPITVASDKIWYAGDKNRIGYISLVATDKIETVVKKDSLKLEFRSIAQTSTSIFVLNIGNPALLYRFSKDLLEKKIVYEEKNEKVFYDSMQFWNDKEGIAIGDPLDNCLSIIITRNGGTTWNKIPCDKLPNIEDGEAAFAASNTNVVVKGTKTWVVSGGKKSRVFYSPDKGNSWEVIETPIVQGGAMTGIFTADFYDENIGFIAGGNFELKNQNSQNKALTIDGGKTWKLVGENNGFGYASCIQFIPNSYGNELVCVGGTGIFYSNDRGNSWKQLSTDTSLFTIRFIDNTTAIAAGKDKIIKISFVRN